MFLIILCICALVAIDQLTKWLAVVHLSESAAKVFIPGLVEFTYHENPGAAWGMLQNHRWVFMLTSTVAIIAILIYLVKSRKDLHPMSVTAFTLIVAGGIGNMIDRLLIGYVVDFINFLFIDFPVFNFADMCVTVGAAIMIVWLLFVDLPAGVREEKAKKANAEEKQ
jgi:signal peptidase II